MTTETVHHEQLATLRGVESPIRTRWTYRTDEPFAVSVSFGTDRGHWIEWIFARDLLITGLVEPAGIGDFRVRPGDVDDDDAVDSDVIVIEIRSPSGHAVFEFDRPGVEDFVISTLRLIAVGEESQHCDIDRLIGELSGS
jgi:hypothetical protein